MLKELFAESMSAQKEEMEANLENSVWAKAYRLMCRDEVGREIVEALEKQKSDLHGKYAIYYDGFLEGKSKAQSIVSAITHNKEKE